MFIFLLLIVYVKESARGAVEVAQKSIPGVECKWGDKGLDEILKDDSILGVAVVLAGQAQVFPHYLRKIVFSYSVLQLA